MGMAVDREVAVAAIQELYDIDMTNIDTGEYVAYNGQTWTVNLLSVN